MKTPTQLIEQLEAVRADIARTAEPIRDAERALSEAASQYRIEQAAAYRRARGTVKDRDHEAVEAVKEFWRAKADAEAVLSYEKLRRANLELQQSNLQTQARLLDMAARGHDDRR